MKQLNYYGVKELRINQKVDTTGGNPIFGIGILSGILALGKALDQAAQWFVEGWNNPK